MSRPPLEVADLVRAAGDAFIERSRTWITWKHVKVLLAIARCRTAALGGHLDECTRCGHRAISYNSCRNRHCPKCQAGARDRWLAARRQELLPTRYVHVVFTLPHELVPLALQNKKVIYDLLFRTSAETLLEIARDPKHLGAEIGFFSVLHTWNQKLQLHPHVHCVVPAGGPSSRPLPLDPLTPHVLSSRQSARTCFSRQVCCGSPTRLPGWPAGFPRRSATARSAQDFLIVAENAIPKRLGSLFETPLRWPPTCPPVSGTLYPSRGRLQPPLGFLCGQQSHFPLARLRSPQRTEVAHPIAG